MSCDDPRGSFVGGFRTPYFQGQQRLEVKSEMTSAGQEAGKWTNDCSLHAMAIRIHWDGQRALVGKADRN